MYCIVLAPIPYVMTVYSLEMNQFFHLKTVVLCCVVPWVLADVIGGDCQHVMWP